jgi:hypothetical protein
MHHCAAWVAEERRRVIVQSHHSARLFQFGYDVGFVARLDPPLKPSLLLVFQKLLEVLCSRLGH